ncbi:MAG TPA: long-chain fatty acid--CoA ligase, partial [Chloroflexota bacterium]|nr:long-chain fatty acid--CoA ligase [Chloroflexota bacterium]
VLGLADDDLGERVIAVVVFRPNVTVPTSDELVALCREQLASYKKPRQVFVVDRLPRNALGKIQKHLVSEMIKDQVGT